MNTIDIILGVILIAAAINGFIKGFFVELASIASLVLGIWAGVEFSGIVRQWLAKYIDWTSGQLGILAFILIFIIVVVVIHLFALLTEKFVRAIALSIFSRVAGALVGVIKTAFILSLVILVFEKIEHFTHPIIPGQTKTESRLYGPIENIAPGIMPFLKEEQQKIFENQPDQRANPQS